MDLGQIEDYIRNHPAQRILGKGGTEQERRENGFRFTNTVALDLRRDLRVNAGLLKKTGGVNAFGYSADRLALKAQDNSVEIFDIIGSSEDPGAHVSFGSNGPVPLSDFGEPDANLGYIVTTVPPIEPPVIEPPIPPVEPPDVDLLQLLNELHASVLNTARIVTQVMPQIDAAFGSIDDRLSRIESAIAAGGGGVAPTYEGSFRILGQTIKFTLTPKA